MARGDADSTPGVGRLWLAGPLLLALSAIVAAVWGGLGRMGLTTPAAPGSLVLGHGPLIANGFFGTVIALERVVALRRAPYAVVPLAAGLGSWAGLLGYSATGGGLVLGAAVGLVAIYAIVYRRDPTPHHAVMGFGALAWAVASGLLCAHAAGLGGVRVAAITPWWAAFLVLTIAGERLELSRVLQLGTRQLATFAAATLAMVGGLTAQLFGLPAGFYLAGGGFAALAIWLLLEDVARRTAGKPGLTGYIGRTLVGGYVWLGVGGLLQLAYGPATGGFAFDAQWHAIFVGFVLTMIFAHAPIMLRSFTGFRVEYHPLLEIAPILIHLTLAVRIGADLIGSPGWRLAGGLGNAFALAIFAAVLGSRVRG